MDVIEPASEASLPERTASPDFQYERPDWTLFRSVGTLPQKAGVETGLLRRLALKELTDNALDAGATVQVGYLDGTGDAFFVEDDGPGIDPDRVPFLFSINRPLVSSKILRLPTRGAMGNGLRVVVGTVAASGGDLVVITRGKRITLHPQDDGSTVADVTDTPPSPGTRVEIQFGPTLPRDAAALLWARAAARMAPGVAYSGKSSPWWYDEEAFFDLIRAAGDRPARALVADLEGCTGAKAGQIASMVRGRTCASLTRVEAGSLLRAARAVCRPVRPERLALNGEGVLTGSYGYQLGEVRLGMQEPQSIQPFAVEAWLEPVSKGTALDRDILFLVNRTPIAGQVWGYEDKGKRRMYGCGLNHTGAFPSGTYRVTINLTVPDCPITSTGKEPDLEPFADAIFEAMRKAARKAKREAPKVQPIERLTAKAVVLANLDEAVKKASGGGKYRFNQRQLFYICRPFVMAQTGAELSYGNFEGIITDYEVEHGDVLGMYRDPRGTLYHPHQGQTIPLGTLAVEAYSRPAWTFGRVLYIEKEGPFEALKAARWPERHDCALLTSKGFTTRAVKDLLDLLAETDEPLKVFCIHDADAAGTMIYQTLQEATRARPTKRTVEVVNLGLEPWEAVAMGLEVEGVDRKKRDQAIASYVLSRPDAGVWCDWLSKHRIELNAMTTPAFIAWLDAKMLAHDGAKVVPPGPVLVDEMEDRIETHARRMITERVLREARVEEQVTAVLDLVPGAANADLVAGLQAWLPAHEDELWKTYVDGLALDAAKEWAE